MAKPRARKLKVFAAHFGFYDTVVAAPSQAAAMRVWGTRQNVFADGQAKLATDAKAIAAALAKPEVMLRRPVGSDAPFEVEPSSLPKVPEREPQKAPKASRPAKRKQPPAPPPADRTALTEAEAAVEALKAEHEAEEADLRDRQAALNEERAEAQQRQAEAKKAAMSELSKARAAYRKAGGRD